MNVNQTFENLASENRVSGPHDAIVRIEDVHKHFGTTQALRGITTHVDKGEVLVIIGPSGCGKSTLLRSINGLETIDSGRVVVDGIVIDNRHKNINAVRAEVGMVFQQFNLFPHLTVLENLTLAQVQVRKRNKQESIQIAHDLLKKVRIPEKADSYPNQLSGGQQQRVAIARALAMNPKVMLFDEPTSALDPEMINEVLDVMLDLAREGMTMLVVSHEMGFARNAANRVVFMEAGTIVAEGPPRELFDQPSNERMRKFLSKILH
jgi:polar amino acid transport system ATP-binding protein